MAENKTKATKGSVSGFLKKIATKQVREDCFTLVDVMGSVSKSEPVMWGSAIVGFGSHHYVYESGREGDMPVIAFSPRKQAIALYFLGGVKSVENELKTLGKHETGKGCLYVKAIGDVKLPVLKKILAKAWKEGTRRKARS
jgi:hypothetical protein